MNRIFLLAIGKIKYPNDLKKYLYLQSFCLLSTFPICYFRYVLPLWRWQRFSFHDRYCKYIKETGGRSVLNEKRQL